jgi:alpha-L-rhamnosidase
MHQPNLRPLSVGLLVGLLAIAVSAMGAVPATAKLANLRCEYLTNPLGIDAPTPRLSWQIDAQGKQDVKQVAYHIQVASSETLLNQAKGDLWDSGKVTSDQSTQITYAGKPLTSRMCCYWRTQIWTSDGGIQSATAMWSMGLPNPDDWHAQWIGRPNNPAVKDDMSLPAHYLESSQ